MDANYDPQAAINFWLAFTLMMPVCFFIALVILGRSQDRKRHNNFDHCPGCQAVYQAEQARRHAR